MLRKDNKGQVMERKEYTIEELYELSKPIQPERSKREDSSCCKSYYVEYSPEWQIPSEWENIKPDGMRCSEHHGDMVRPAEKIWPA
jgi:hypothetical protein